MIVMRHKPLDEIRQMLSGWDRVLLVGCGTCATVALAGGEQEVATLAEALRLAASREGVTSVFDQRVVQRQCDPEFIEELVAGEFDAVLALGCGAGVALIAQMVDVPVFPACDTLFIGVAEGLGAWRAECSACARCVLGETGGICPVTRCAKGIMNGPCGGVKDGRCELGDRDCAWVLIHERLEHQGRGAMLREQDAPGDHSVKSTCPRWDVTEGVR